MAPLTRAAALKAAAAAAAKSKKAAAASRRKAPPPPKKTGKSKQKTAVEEVKQNQPQPDKTPHGSATPTRTDSARGQRRESDTRSTSQTIFRSTAEPVITADPVTVAMVAHLRALHDSLSDAIRGLSLWSHDTTANLLCRERQVAEVQEFLRTGSQYTLQLFGMPGTGKTAAVQHALADMKERARATASPLPEMTTLYFNGYVLQRPTDVYSALLRHLATTRLSKKNASRCQQLPTHQAAAAIDSYMRGGWDVASVPMCVVIVDEVDKCCEHSGRTLFRLVDWLTLPHAHCKLVTIANSMQLPERLDAKTRSRLNTTQRVTFASYTTEELQQILQQRLADHRQATGRYPVFSAAGEQYICRQIGLHNGDVRRLLQTSAAALQETLCTVDAHCEQLFAGKASVETVQSSLAHYQIPATPAEAQSSGIVQMRHLFGVVRNVLHDRFPAYLDAVQGPLVYITIIIIASEAARAESVREVGAAAEVLSLERLYQHACAAVENHFSNERCEPLTFTQFLGVIEELRQVNFVELSLAEGQVLLHDAKRCLSISEPVSVAITHPAQDILARCEGHELYQNYGVHLKHRLR